MYLDPKKYRFTTSFTGSLILQVSEGYDSFSGARIEDPVSYKAHWRNARISDLGIIPNNQPKEK